MKIISFNTSLTLRFTFSAAMLCMFTFLTTTVKAEASVDHTPMSIDRITKDSLVEYTSTFKMRAIPDKEVRNQAVMTFNSDHDEAIFFVFNMNGILAKEEKFAVINGEQNTVNLDLSDMKSGLYYIVHDKSNSVAAFNVE